MSEECVEPKRWICRGCRQPHEAVTLICEGCLSELAALRAEVARLRAAGRMVRSIALREITDAGDRNAPPALLAICKAMPADMVAAAASPPPAP